MTTEKSRRLPCPEQCEDGTIYIDTTRRSDWEPSERRGTCETCDGEGTVEKWTCGTCSQTFGCKNEMPAWTAADGSWHQCGGCKRLEALDGVDFAAWARGLREALGLIDEIWRPDSPLVRGVATGRAQGAVRHYAEKLEKLAKDLEVGRE